MKSVKWTLGTVIVLVLGLIAAGYLLPARTHIQRQTYVPAPPGTVYNLIVDLGQFQKWSPWNALDEDIQYRIEQPNGLNATLHWNSDNPDIGAGKLTVIDAQPFRKLRLLLDFKDGGEAVIGYRLELLEDGTHIVWTYDRQYGDNPISRYRGLFHERRVETIYTPGFDRLRRLAEAQSDKPEVDVVTETLDYEVDGESYTGYLAYDQNRQSRPGVLIVHEWWGHTDYVRRRAEQLAELGYVALALDMYGQGQTASHPDQAAGLSTQVKENFESAKRRFNAALEILEQHPASDPEQTAAIGYCFGGGLVLNMARAGIDLDGVVSFHGTLTPINEPATRGDIQASILVLNGGADPLVPDDQVEAFVEEIDNAGVDYELINYPGAQHAFTNPAADEYAEQFDLPVAYNARADKQSWQQMRNFFGRIFR